jgi:hypothetical protein
MASFADPPPRPRRFSFVAIEPAYEDYGWRVRLRRSQLEFSRLAVRGARRFALSGSGSAVVRTPPRFEPGTEYTVSLRGDRPATSLVRRPSSAGVLRIPLELGPSNPFQQYTAEAEAAGTKVFTERVRIGVR